MSIPGTVWLISGLMIVALMFLMSVLAKLYRKAGPHEALIVYGFGLREPKIVKGHGTVILPLLHTAKWLSLELMSFDVAPQQDLYTRQGVAVTVEAVAQIKVKSDPESIRTASEQFLTKTPSEREGLIRLVMEGHLRGIIGQLAVEEIVKQPEMVGERMRSTCAAVCARSTSSISACGAAMRRSAANSGRSSAPLITLSRSGLSTCPGGVRCSRKIG